MQRRGLKEYTNQDRNTKQPYAVDDLAQDTKNLYISRVRSKSTSVEKTEKTEKNKPFFARVLSSLGLYQPEKPAEEPEEVHNYVTSTPLNSPANLPTRMHEISPINTYTDYVSLGIYYGNDGSEHEDYTNDIIAYMFHKQFRLPSDLQDIWGADGLRKYAIVVNHLIRLHMDMPSLNSTCFHLAVYYVNHTMAKNPAMDLHLVEDLCLAAFDVADKIENQRGIFRSPERRKLNVSKRNVASLERLILKSLNFDLNPVTHRQFINFLAPAIFGPPGLGKLVKFLITLSLTNPYLASLDAALLTAVCVRYVAHINNQNGWVDNMYSIMGYDRHEYDVPTQVLSRLLIIARYNQEFYEIYTCYLKLAEEMVSVGKEWILQNALEAAEIPVYQKKPVDILALYNAL